MSAHVFERQVEVLRGYCAQDADAAGFLEAGITRFRAGNPDFVRALDERPTAEAFVADVQAFDARFEAIAGAMHDVLATQPPREHCEAIAERVGAMRFDAMLAEATRGMTGTATAAVP